MRLIVSIDTEEDNWLGYQCNDYTTDNAARLPELQRLFDEFGVRPTYLVSHVMAADPVAATFLRGVHAEGKCEIGAHCHPWNTPPLEETRGAVNSMLCNLPSSLQYQKLRTLTEAIADTFGVRPTSFRAGRWGYDQVVGSNLTKLGYGVDTSVTPYIDWTSEHGPDFSRHALKPSWSTLGELFEGASDEPIVEVPATVGFLQKNFRRVAAIQRVVLRRPFRRLRVHGLLARLGWLNRVWLCPEHHSVEELIALTDVLRGKNVTLLNMMFHSCTLQAGLTPFVRCKLDERRFVERLRRYFEYVTMLKCRFVTLRESAIELAKPLEMDDASSVRITSK